MRFSEWRAIFVEETVNGLALIRRLLLFIRLAYCIVHAMHDLRLFGGRCGVVELCGVSWAHVIHPASSTRHIDEIQMSPVSAIVVSPCLQMAHISMSSIVYCYQAAHAAYSATLLYRHILRCSLV